MSSVGTIEIDLHYLNAEDALREVRETMQSYVYKNREICFIVGQGYHSPDYRPVLKPKVEQWLSSNGYSPRVNSSNPGRIYVYNRERSSIESHYSSIRLQSSQGYVAENPKDSCCTCSCCICGTFIILVLLIAVLLISTKL